MACAYSAFTVVSVFASALDSFIHSIPEYNSDLQLLQDSQVCKTSRNHIANVA